VRAERALHRVSRPLEGGGGALGAEGLTQLLGLRADFGDGLMNGAGLRGHEKTHPRRFCAGGVGARVRLCAYRDRKVKALGRPGIWVGVLFYWGAVTG